MINHEFANGSLARAGAGRNLKSSIERRAGVSPLGGHIWREAEGVAANASPPFAVHVCVRVPFVFASIVAAGASLTVW